MDGGHEILPYYLRLRSCLRTAALVFVFARYVITIPFQVIVLYIYYNGKAIILVKTLNTVSKPGANRWVTYSKSLGI